MQRLKKRLEIGLRWLTCGGRLFARNPWLLGGMGFSSAVLISLLALVPVVNDLLVALVAPILLGSAYLAIDTVSRQKMPLPPGLRMTVIKRSPIELVSIFRKGSRIMQTIVAIFYSLTAVLLINLAVRLIAGSSWVSPWLNLEWLPLLGVLAIFVLVLALYLVLAMTLIFTLPLVFLQNRHPISAFGDSIKASFRHFFSVSMVLGLLLAPIFLGRLGSFLSYWVTYLVWVVVGTVVLPIVAASLYCSYRTLFPVRELPRAS